MKLGARVTYAIDARNGKKLWTFADGRYSPVVADSQRLYLVGNTAVYGLVEKRKAAKPKKKPSTKKTSRAKTPTVTR